MGACLLDLLEGIQGKPSGRRVSGEPLQVQAVFLQVAGHVLPRHSLHIHQLQDCLWHRMLHTLTSKEALSSQHIRPTLKVQNLCCMWPESEARSHDQKRITQKTSISRSCGVKPIETVAAQSARVPKAHANSSIAEDEQDQVKPAAWLFFLACMQVL